MSVHGSIESSAMCYVPLTQHMPAHANAAAAAHAGLQACAHTAHSETQRLLLNTRNVLGTLLVLVHSNHPRQTSLLSHVRPQPLILSSNMAPTPLDQVQPPFHACSHACTANCILACAAAAAEKAEKSQKRLEEMDLDEFLDGGFEGATAAAASGSEDEGGSDGELEGSEDEGSEGEGEGSEELGSEEEPEEGEEEEGEGGYLVWSVFGCGAQIRADAADLPALRPQHVLISCVTGAHMQQAAQPCSACALPRT